ncbi:hypothetical protein Hanom_Chr05g00451971 [Helianthus anomalus]
MCPSLPYESMSLYSLFRFSSHILFLCISSWLKGLYKIKTISELFYLTVKLMLKRDTELKQWLVLHPASSNTLLCCLI